jgi:hypothetical protein
MNIPADHPSREFRIFSEKIWKHLNLPPLTPVQRDICDWLQYGGKRTQVHAFRGCGKSYLCSAYVLWSLFLNPEEKILVISASKERADSFVKFTRRLIDEVSFLQHLRPDRNRGDRDSNISFDVGAAKAGAHSPSVKAAGITGQITGARGSLIVLDDVEVPGNSATPAMREKLAESIKEIDAILLPESKELKVDPRVRILGTPQSMETIYATLEERGYQTRVWPIEVPEEHTASGYHGNLAPMVQKMLDDGEPAGTPVEPSRFPKHDIAERRLSYGTLGFMLQFMLSTALSDAEKFPLKTKDLIVAAFPADKAREVYVHSNHPMYRLKEHPNVGMHGDGFFAASDEIGEYAKFDSTIVAVDPSARGRDETAVVSLSSLGGQLFLHRSFGLLSGYSEETLEAIARECGRVRANKVVVESNFGDGMFSQLLKPVLNRIYPCSIEEVRNSQMKEQRMIDTLAPVIEGHRLIVHESVLPSDRVPHSEDSLERQRDRQLFFQMTHLTAERQCLAHDDRLDCLALAVGHFNTVLLLDAQAELRARAEAEWDTLAGTPQQTNHNWLNYGAETSPFSADPFAL